MVLFLFRECLEFILLPCKWALIILLNFDMLKEITWGRLCEHLHCRSWHSTIGHDVIPTCLLWSIINWPNPSCCNIGKKLKDCLVFEFFFSGSFYSLFIVSTILPLLIKSWWHCCWSNILFWQVFVVSLQFLIRWERLWFFESAQRDDDFKFEMETQTKEKVKQRAMTVVEQS